MEFQNKTIQRRRQAWAIAVVVGTAMWLSACGGGSGGVDSEVLMPPLATAKSCNNIAGTLDAVQSTLLGQLTPVVQGIPTVGPAAAGATTALSRALDTVDALSGSLSTLAATRSPQQFTTGLSGVGDSLLCASSSLSESLALLAGQSSVPVPGLSQVQASLAALAGRVATGLVGSTPGGDLTQLTNQLVVLANQLQGLAGQLPVPVNQPYLQQVLALNATTFSSLALLLDDTGKMNGDKLATDTTALLLALANNLSLPLPTQLGLPSNGLAPVISQLRAASEAIRGGLSAVASPTLQAVSAVLGAGGAAGSFPDLLIASLPGTDSASSSQAVARLSQALQGSGGLSLLTALLQAFGGQLPG